MRSPTPAPLFCLLVALAPSWMALALHPDRALAANAGQWASVTRDAPAYAVHLGLLRGDGNPYHSRILWWRGEDGSTFLGREWGWKSSMDACSFPSATENFVSLNPAAPGVDIFCGGNTTLADGRMFIPGGTHPTSVIYGENRTRSFAAGAGSAAGTWSDPGPMAQWRWYPTTVALKDGRALVLSGIRHRHHRTFGGRRNGQAPAPSPSVNDSLHRFVATIPSGQWDQSLIPAADPTYGRPVVEEHTMVQMEAVAGFDGHVLFGGKDEAGEATNETWVLERQVNATGPDYTYSWSQKFPASPPLARSEQAAVAVDGAMLIYGGVRDNGQVRDDVRKLHNVPLQGPTWSPIDITGGPVARYGQAAVWDTNTVFDAGVPRRRLIAFGGASSSGADPTDATVRELRFTNSLLTSATWHTLTMVDLDGLADPSARLRHSLSLDPYTELRTHSPSGKSGRVAFLFGGSPTTTTYSNDLFALWIFTDGTAGWERKTFGGAAPGARANHSATIDRPQVQGVPSSPLYIYGGVTSGGPADANAYTVDPWASSPTWSVWAQAEGSRSGHTLTLDLDPNHARVAETYDPIAPSWQAHPAAALAQNTYPLAFAVSGSTTPGGRVASLAWGGTLHRLDLPAQGQAAGAWQAYSGGLLDVNSFTGVIYRPDSLLVGGGISNGQLVGTTKTFDAGNTAATWVAAGAMVPRFFHNLVLMPDGQVLAVGGQAVLDEFNFGQPVKRPQLWNPVSRAWGDTTLAAQPGSRGYHSTALLLPDGRVLSGGGEYPNDKFSFDLFCPPYLYQADGTTPASRPRIEGSFDTLGYGQVFDIVTYDAADISSVCLVRPGATTHNFNQDQRYIPLSFYQAPLLCRVMATSPASADHAPPGDYLLFILKVNPSTGLQVPSLARWVRVRPGALGGPPQIPEGCGGGGGGCPVAETRTAAGWSEENTVLARSLDGSFVTDALRLRHAPADQAGSLEVRLRENEQEVTTLDHVRLVSVDHGPGVSAYWSGEEMVLGERRAAYRVTTAAGLDVTALVSGGRGRYQGLPGDILEIELRAPGEGGETLLDMLDGREVVEADEKMGPSPGSLKPLTGARPAEIDRAVLVGSGLLVQVPEAGGWRTVQHLHPREQLDEALLGAEGGSRFRLVFVGHHGLGFVGRVAVVGRTPGHDHRLGAARHSRLGDVTSAVAGSGGAVTTLVPADTVTLAFAVADVPPGQVRDYFLVSRGVYTALAAPDPAADGPLRFALHPNRPNPFSGSTTIRFEVPRAGPVKLEVFDLPGRRIRTLIEGSRAPGVHAAVWDHRDRRGASVPPGVYRYRLTAGEFREERTMVLVP